MNRGAVILIGLALTAGASLSAAAPGELKVLVLEGPPYQRGATHGRTLKSEIAEVVRLWKAELAGAFKTDADTFIRRFVRQTEFPSAIRKWTPDLWDEICGMADGAGVDFDTMLALQLPDECFVHGEAIAG